MRRYIDGKSVHTGRNQEEVAQLVNVIKKADPDVLGICEIGTVEDLKQLQRALMKAGVQLPYYFHTGGSDSLRKQAFLSKFKEHIVCLEQRE